MRSLYGVQALMVPCYILASTLKIALSAALALHPGSLDACLRLVVVHSTFAYVRFFHYVFALYGVFVGSEYTAAVMLAGLVTFPVLGPAANLAALMFMVAGLAVYASTGVGEDGPAFVERSRGLIHGLGLGAPAAARCAAVLLAAQPSLANPLRGGGTARPSWPFVHLPSAAFHAQLEGMLRDDKVLAHLAFAALDSDGGGALSRRSMRLLLFHWGRYCPMATELLEIAGGAGDEERVSFEAFFSGMRTVWAKMESGLRTSLATWHMQQRRQVHVTGAVSRDKTSRALLAGRSFLGRR